ncbi:PadR family transcriptional regulator [soil metagenome]
MGMNRQLKQGTLDIVLLSILEGDARYGLEILKEVNLRTDGAFDFRKGSLYPALHRLVKAGWVETFWQDSSAGGAPRKYYSLTDEGRKTGERKKAEWQALRKALDAILNPFGSRLRGKV